MDKLLAPLLTRFSVIRLKSYTKEEFVEIVVKVLNRDKGIEKYTMRSLQRYNLVRSSQHMLKQTRQNQKLNVISTYRV
jgi:ATP-dependent Lon protease